MNFRTEIPTLKPNFSIFHKDIILSIGSCFANEIGTRLKNDKFNIYVNPTGVTYNPLSISQTLSLLSDGIIVRDSDLFFHHDLWHDFRFHGSFSRPTKQETVSATNAALRSTPSSPTLLIVTLGTAFVYFHGESVVNNCHKLPASSFTRRLLSVNECADSLKQALLRFIEHFPTLSKIIITVSPIRHLADGAHQNTLSKSTLHLAAQQVCDAFASVPSVAINYFPAYEILLDELRDYRFYADDMTHPSPLAFNYIYQRFSDAFFSKETIALISQCEKLRKACQHRPLSSALSDERRQFLLTTIASMQSLQRSHNLNFSSEISQLQSQLTD